MRTLREIVREYAPKRCWAWLGIVGEDPPTVAELERRVARAGAVARLLAADGWQEVETEWEKQDRAWLEQLVQPQSHEQYLEARGAVRGLRQAHELVRQILAVGQAAETELARRRVQR